MFSIKEYIEEMDFWKNDTKDAVAGLYAYMLNNNIPTDDAGAWVGRIVNAMKGEYGE